MILTVNTPHQPTRLGNTDGLTCSLKKKGALSTGNIIARLRVALFWETVTLLLFTQYFILFSGNIKMLRLFCFLFSYVIVSFHGHVSRSEFRTNSQCEDS